MRLARSLGAGLLVVPCAAGALADGAREPLERVAWLAGCWEARSARRSVEEYWMSARGGSMLGMGRTVRSDTLVDYEIVVLRAAGGGLAYEAHPFGQATAVFLSTGITDTSVVFENAEHDFPKRIAYWQVGRDSVVARVDGGDGSTHRPIEYRYRRAPCEGG